MLEKLKKWFGEEQGGVLHAEFEAVKARLAVLEAAASDEVKALEARIAKLENSVHG